MVNRTSLVGLFEVELKTRHNILVEFLNNLKTNSKHNKIKVMMSKEQRIIDKHLLVEVFEIYHTKETKVDQAKMSNVRITLAYIDDNIPNTYNNNERWVIKKMISNQVNRIVVILPIIYQKDKAKYFSNKSAMMISKTNHGEFVNWATIMYFQLVKDLIRWEKCQKKHD